MLYQRGRLSFLCTKFSGLTSKMIDELANYHYVFIIGFRNTKTLEIIDTIGEQMAECIEGEE